MNLLTKLFFCYFSLFNFPFFLSAQTKNPPLHPKKFSFEIEAELASKKMSASSAAYHYTYIGNYQKALENYALPLDWGLDTMTLKDSLQFLAYKPVNAFEYLKEATKKAELVIISEAHHLPQHRIFTKDLLETLYQNGFRHLGLETLSPAYEENHFLMDKNLKDRCYPLNSPLTGYYTREPQMGNLVREALDLGFKIFGYERTDRKTERDLQQAENIAKYIKAHPNEKIVIHCGWYHAIESDFPKRKTDNYMAFHLKNKTGIDPLTIYQDAFSEKLTMPESPFYRMIKSDEVSVLLDKEGKAFSGVEEAIHFNMHVYHPRTMYLKNRPNWLLKPGENQFVPINKNKIGGNEYPVLIEAFPIGESFSVPVDIIEMMDSEDPSELILKPGEYTIRITTKSKKTMEYKKEVIFD